MRVFGLCVAAVATMAVFLLSACARPTAGCTNATCADGVPCTADYCDQTANACAHVADDSACASGEYCDLLVGCVEIIKCDIQPDCDDGLFCNGVELCTGGACAAGTPPDCTDAIPCTIGLCDGTNGACVQVPDHSACAPGEQCDPGLGCVTVPSCTLPADCDDGLFCNGAEGCTGNLCTAGTPPACDDGIACTVDLCDEATTACTNVPNPATCGPNETCVPGVGCMPECTGNPDCDDGDACTIDTCLAGMCAAPGAVNCDDGVGCTSDTCDPGTGCMNAPSNAACGDGDVCTDDVCDPVLDCQYPFNTAACDDGDPSTTGDVCSVGVCSGTPVSPPGMQSFSYTGTVQLFVVPAGVTTITIEAWGAQGGDGYAAATSPGGLGAYVAGDFAVTPGQTLEIVVGGTGSDGAVVSSSSLNGGGGGGGSFVNDLATGMPLAIGGGGGGGCNAAGAPGDPGHSNTSGGAGSYTAALVGEGGFTDNCCGGGSGCGGGGWSSGGVSNNWCTGGQAAGGAGGAPNARGFGGFGGGGGVYHGGGGGGGYTGGSGGHPPSSSAGCGGGGGGGSFNAGTSPSATGGVRAGDGLVTISW